MPQFPDALRSALESIEWTQAQLADLCNVPTPQLSKYVTGAIPPGADVAVKIVSALPERVRPQIILAWLQDRVPEEFREMVKLQAHGGKVPRLPSDLSLAVRSAIEHLAREASRNPVVSALLVQLSRALQAD